MKRFIRLTILCLIFLLATQKNQAAHVAGITFEYECIGSDQYIITLILWRDCAATTQAPAAPNVTFTNSCGTTFNTVFTLQGNGPSGYEISDICQNLQGSTTCNGGTYPGMEMYIYKSTVQFPPSCNGEITALAFGGAGGLTYSWPNGKTGANQSGLCAGRYIVTVTDNSGCTAMDTVAIYDPSGLDLTTTTTEISCNGACDGNISVVASGGAAPYTFSWSHGASGPTQSNLCPGQYAVTVMDDNGNQFREYITLNNPSPIFINFTTIDESCAGSCDGMLRANVSGGTAPYTYNWSGGLSGATNSNVCAGTYNLTITDANGCTETATGIVSSPTALSGSIVITTSINCYGTCDGELITNVSGGTAPYSFSWSNGITTNINDNLCAGNYSVTITDANGCSITSNSTLNQPSQIVSNPTITDINCGATCNGAISISVTGGSAPYSYSWAGTAPIGGNTNSVGSLCTGTYFVTITDATGCSIIKTYSVKNIGTSATATITQPSCYNLCDGQIVINPTYGSAPYTYNWTNGSTSNTASNLCGTYHSVTITDNSGCIYVETFELIAPDSIQPNATVTNPTCNSNCDGSITLSPIGGNGTYSYSWNIGATSSSVSNLCSGTYTVTISDGNGCQFIDSYTINNSSFSSSITINSAPVCTGKCDGELVVSTTGGVAPFTYSWNNGGTLPYLFDLCGGNYTVTVTDANGCTTTSSITLITPTPITVSINTLNSPSCSGLWESGYGVCCRNNAISNITTPGTNSIYGKSIFNAAFEYPECTSSVQFFNDYTGSTAGGCQRVSSLTYGCVGQYDCYTFLQNEPDGDHLVYSLVNPLTGANSTATFLPQFSATNPFPGQIYFDAVNGQVCYNIPTAGYYQFTLRVDEYDPVSGLYRGTIFRDIQLVIMSNCTPNITPQVQGNSIYNFSTTSSASIVNTNEISMCEGDDFCYSVTFVDSNLTDVNLCLTSNVQDILNGPNPSNTATIAISAVDTVVSFNLLDSALRITADVCWTAPPNSNGSYIVKFNCSDDHCPSPSNAEFSMTVNVIGSTTVSPDVTICGSQSAQLIANGGNTFSWRAISGDSIQVGVNFSCDSCISPIANPSQTTVYEVTSDLIGSCKNKDTVMVTVAPDFTVLAAPDTVICTHDSIQLNAIPSMPGIFTYDWSPAIQLNNSTIANPKTLVTQTTTFNVSVESADNCIKSGSNTITVIPLFPPLSISTSDTLLCDGDSADLEVILGNITPTSCGLSSTPCYGTSSSGIVGTGTSSNTNNSYPAPFGNNTVSSKHQMLVRASELTAAGFSAGLINGIAFDISSVNGSAAYSDFTVGLACISQNALPFTWTPTTQVLPPTTVTLQTGWNWLSFPMPYMWDGTSNIVVETCFQNLTSTQNSSTNMTNTGFLSTVYSTGAGACTSPSAAQGSLSRPNINFEFCAAATPNGYTFDWTPNLAITNTNQHNPTVYPPITTTYEVIVNDTFGVCSDTAEITIQKAEIDAGNDTIICMNDSIQLSPIVIQSCGTGTPSYSWSPITGLSSTSILNPMLSINQTTTYYLTYTDPCGCILTDSITVIVNEIDTPTATITPPTCAQSDGSYLLHATSGYPPYEFSIDSGLTFQSDSLFTNLAMGIYHWMIRDSIGCVSPIQVDTLLSPTTPVIDSLNLVHVSCYGNLDGSIEIFTSNGEPPLTYSIDSGNTYYADSSFTNLGGGIYHIFVKDAFGCISFPVTDTLFPVAELAIDSILSQNIDCNGDSTGWINVFASGGTPPISYSIDNGVTYQSNQLFSNLQAGAYQVIVKDFKNCLGTSQIEVLTEPSPIQVGLTVMNDTCYNACGGLAIATVSGGISPFQYEWLTNTTPQYASGTNGLTSNYLCEGSYIFKVTDSSNCEFDTTFVIEQPDPLLIDSTLFTNITCNGDSNGTITVYVSGGTKPYNYSIDGGQSFNQTFLDSIFIGDLSAGVYSIVLQDSGFRCTTNMQITLTQPDPISLSLPFAQQTICVGNCINLSANAAGGNGAPYIYHWSESNMNNSSSQSFCPTQPPSQDANVVVFAEDVNGCISGFESFTIGLYDSLQVQGVKNDGICPGESVQLDLNVAGGDGNGFNYTWSPSSSLSNSYSKNPVASPTQTTSYVIRLSDNCGSPSVLDTIDVIVHPIPTVVFDVIDTLQGCEPFDVTLVNQSKDVVACHWTIGNEISATGFSADVYDLNDGSYDVSLKVKSQYGCENELIKSDYLTVYPQPTANFSFGPQPTTTFDPKITFNNLSSDDVVNFNWDFAGLGSSNEIDPSFEFPSNDTGKYDISLTVITPENCTNDTLFTVSIDAESNLFVPNSFTPNGDGLNDVFAPGGVGLNPIEYSFSIYDRWGNLVYESNSLSKPWDGRIQKTGKMAQNGTYVWKISAKDYTVENEKIKRNGYINLLR